MVTDPDAVAYVTDAFGEPMAAIYVHDLRSWLWTVAAVDSWLQHASAATRGECNQYLAARGGGTDCAGVGPSTARRLILCGSTLLSPRVLRSTEC